MVAKILVATDGSMASDTAIDYAGELAMLYGGELIILNVIRTDVITTYRQIDREYARERVMQEREEASKMALGRGTNRAKRADVEAEGVVRRGQPDEEIVNFAKEQEDVELIVMGAFGKNFIERQIVGSKTEGVLREITKLDIPLVVVPHPCKRCKGDIQRKILVATDGSEASDNALEHAIEVTKMYGAELLIMNVIRKGLKESFTSLKGDPEEYARAITEESVKKAGEQGVHAEGIIKKGFVDNEIVKFVRGRDDLVLLVMGAYGKNFLERQLAGSKTQGVLRKIPELDVPLVVVPRPIKETPILKSA
jgi:nucleotide-binding universal stress UspA family protein